MTGRLNLQQLMDALLWIGLFIVSLAVLVKGSDWFIDAAEEIGLALGIPSFVIGVTIVAMGTSLPELASSIAAIMSGESEIVISNAIGSNIANIALVLGITALVGKKVAFKVDLMVTDIPLLVCSAFLLWFFLQPDADSVSRIDLLEACLLLLSLVIFLAYSFTQDGTGDKEVRPKINIKTYAFLLLGGVAVYLGATYTVTAITELSQIFGIESGAIASSAVAVGTSLPEIVVSVAATQRGNPEIAIGNILGSNVFNTFAVVGIPALIGELAIPDMITAFALPMMIALTLLFFFIMISKTVSRWEGLMLLIFYIYFIVKLF